MPYRRTIFLADEHYHLYNRGGDRANVFFHEDHYRYFIRLVDDKAARHSILIVAICLMPNHFHLLVRPQHDHTVSRFLNGLLGSYVQGVNAARKRVGPLFQGRTRSVHVSDDIYLAHLARYIHLNPVTAGLVARPQDWPFSNYSDIATRARPFSDGKVVGGVFPTSSDDRRFVEAPSAFELPASLKLAGS
jgi:REP element-mobilizing transposase RayT